MKRDSRLPVALHLLLHMDEAGCVMTSEALGPMMKMNPVVVRRTMAGLREAGIVQSEKGHGGGWRLARPLRTVSLGEVYRALGTSALFGIGYRDESPRCLLEQAVNRAIAQTLEDAEARVMAHLDAISLADLAADAPRPHLRPHESPKKRKKKGAHAHV